MVRVVSVRPRPLSEPHWTWDPEVHNFYNETCHFFLVRFAARNVTASRVVLTSALEQSQLDAYSMYLLLGYHDALLRVWLTPQKRRRLVERLRGMSSSIESVEEFRADQIEYSWTSTPPSEDAIRSHRQIVETAAQQLAEHGSVTDEFALGQLLAGGMLHRVPIPQESEAIKVYVAVSRLSTDGEKRIESHRMFDVLRQTGATAISLYHGVGFADTLIKCFLPTFSSVIPLLGELQVAIPSVGLTTFLIGENAPLEFDNIDVWWKEFSNELLDLEHKLGAHAASQIAALSDEERLAVGTFYRNYSSQLVNTQAEKYFLGYLDARLSQSPESLAQQLVFIIRLEGLLRERILRVSTECGGADWFQSLKTWSASSRAGKEELRSPKDWTYADLGPLVKGMQAIGWISANDQQLGDSLLGLLPELTKLRNQVAHGSLFEDDAASAHWSGDWPKNAGIVGQALVLFSKLIAARDMRTIS